MPVVPQQLNLALRSRLTKCEMDDLLLKIEKVLRWYLSLTPQERAKRSAEISEAFQVIVDQIDQSGPHDK